MPSIVLPLRSEDGLGSYDVCQSSVAPSTPITFTNVVSFVLNTRGLAGLLVLRCERIVRLELSAWLLRQPAWLETCQSIDDDD